MLLRKEQGQICTVLLHGKGSIQKQLNEFEQGGNMKNVRTSIKDNVLTIEVDLAVDFGRSKSGKSIIIASTEGNKALEEDTTGAVIGLNIYRKA